MPDLAIARCFAYRGADGVLYEFACGCIYPAMSDEFAGDWYVQAHTEQAVRARGAALIAYRQQMVLDNATGTYAPTSYWLTVLLQPGVNPEYSQVLALGARPLFQSDIDGFGYDIERPPPEPGNGVISGASLGMNGYRSWGPHHSRDYHNPTVRVYPGDPSPPVGRATGANIGRTKNEEAAHFAMQQTQLRVAQEINAHYTAELPAAPSTAPRPITREMANYHDPRQATPARHIEQATPTIAERQVTVHDIVGERVRARLERRAVQSWARL